MDKRKSIEALQFFVTGLSEGAFVHKVQGQIFNSESFNKLGEKYIGHFNEEMEWVEKFIDRIIDLGGCPKVEKHDARELICDPLEYVKADLAIQVKGVDILRNCMASLTDDQEEDLYWSEEQLELIEKIGYQNWLIKQM